MDNPGKLATKTQDEGKQKKNTTQYKTNKQMFYCQSRRPQ
jgi:hypothetical protein